MLVTLLVAEVGWPKRAQITASICRGGVWLQLTWCETEKEINKCIVLQTMKFSKIWMI